MQMQKIINIVISILTSFALSYVAAAFLTWSSKDIFGYHLFSLTAASIIIYRFNRDFHLFDTIIVIFFLSIINGYFLSRTSISIQIDGFPALLLYSLLLFIAVFLSLRFSSLFRLIKYFRNIIFSLISALLYSLIHLLVHKVFLLPLDWRIMKQYFFNSLLIFIVISLIINISEKLIIYLGKHFRQTPPDEK